MKPFTPAQVRFLQEIAQRLRVRSGTFDSLMDCGAVEHAIRKCRIAGHYSTWVVTDEAKAQLAKQVAAERELS